LSVRHFARIILSAIRTIRISQRIQFFIVTGLVDPRYISLEIGFATAFTYRRVSDIEEAIEHAELYLESIFQSRLFRGSQGVARFKPPGI
jgi:hypothetical protein